MNKLPSATFVYTGMPLTIIASNPAIKLGVVNGTACAFVKFYPEPRLREVDIVTEGGKGITVLEPDGSMPKVMFVYVPGLKRTVPGLPDSIFPIFPIERTIRVNTRESRNVPIKIQQFPVMPRFSLTGHKTQGQTMSSIVVHLPSTLAERSRIPGSWLYVQFSRVRKLQDLYLTNPLTLSDTASFKPNQRAQKEMERLSNLEEQTIGLAEGLIDQAPIPAMIYPIPRDTSEYSPLPPPIQISSHPHSPIQSLLILSPLPLSPPIPSLLPPSPPPLSPSPPPLLPPSPPRKRRKVSIPKASSVTVCIRVPPVLTYHLVWKDNSCWLDASLVVLASSNAFRRFLVDFGDMSSDCPTLGMIKDIITLLTNPPVPGGADRLNSLKNTLCFNLQPPEGRGRSGGICHSSTYVIECIIKELSRHTDPWSVSLIRSYFMLSYNMSYPTCRCVDTRETMMFCLFSQNDLRDGMCDRDITHHSHPDVPPPDHLIYSFLDPFPEMIIVDTATDRSHSRNSPAEIVTLKGATYRLQGGTCYVNGNHYHAVIHRPDGWIDVDSMEVPSPLFPWYLPTLPSFLPVFGWMIYEKQ